MVTSLQKEKNKLTHNVLYQKWSYGTLLQQVSKWTIQFTELKANISRMEANDEIIRQDSFLLKMQHGEEEDVLILLMDARSKLMNFVEQSYQPGGRQP